MQSQVLELAVEHNIANSLSQNENCRKRLDNGKIVHKGMD